MDAVGELIKARPEVSKIEFESADEAWEKMKKEYFRRRCGGSRRI